MILVNFFIIHKNDFSVLDVISPLFSFIFIGGPLISYIAEVTHLNSSKKS